MAETVGGGIGLIGPVAGGTLIELVGTDEAFATRDAGAAGAAGADLCECPRRLT